MAGVKDVWSKTYGASTTKINLIKAAEKALKSLMQTKLQQIHYQRLSVSEGQPAELKDEKEFIEETAVKETEKKENKKARKKSKNDEK